MNLVQANMLREVAGEIKAKGGALQFKAHALKNLELRTVLKESHNSPIVDLVFNTLDTLHHNLFASVGSDQATVYDDQHMGDFLSVVVHYVNSPSAHHRGGELTCCAWVQMNGIARHELGDACLAVSGPEGVIQIISVVEARVVSLLRGHPGEVVELRGCAGVPGLLVSLGADGSIRLWDVASSTCICKQTSDAVALEVHPEGCCFFTGHRGGRICRWDLHLDTGGRPPQLSSNQPTSRAAADPAEGPRHTVAAINPCPDPGAYLDAATAAVQPTSTCQDLSVSGSPLPCFPPQQSVRPLALRGTPPVPEQLQLSGTPLADQVNCIRWLPLRGGSLAGQSPDGRLAVWELAAGEQLLALRVPGTYPPGGAKGGGPCRFSATRDGAFICVGNSAGDVYVYDTRTGSRAAHYSSQKIRGPARAAALSDDGRHLLTVHGNGYILRYEYIRKPASAAAADPRQPQEQLQSNSKPDGPVEACERATSPVGADGLASSRDISPEPCPGDEAGPTPALLGAAGSGLCLVEAAEEPTVGDLGVKRSRHEDGAVGHEGGEEGPGGKRLKGDLETEG